MQSIAVCKPILVGRLNDDIKPIFLSIADRADFETEVMETDNNHLHFLIRYIPRLSIAQIVRRLKQDSTHQIWLLHSSRYNMGIRSYFGQMAISFVQ